MECSDTAMGGMRIDRIAQLSELINDPSNDVVVMTESRGEVNVKAELTRLRSIECIHARMEILDSGDIDGRERLYKELNEIWKTSHPSTYTHYQMGRRTEKMKMKRESVGNSV